MNKRGQSPEIIISLLKYIRRRITTACPLPLDQAIPPSISAIPSDHKSLCLSLVENLIKRGLISSAQQVIYRIISQSPSLPEAISAVDFAIMRGMELNSFTYGSIITKLVDFGEAQVAEQLYIDKFVRSGVNPDPFLLDSMLVCYCKLGKLDEARSHFGMIINRKNFVHYKEGFSAFLRLICEQLRVLEAFDCFVRINDAGLFLGFSSYKMLIEELCISGYLDEAIIVFNLMYDRGIPPVFSLWKSLILGFCKHDQPVEAEMLSAEMESCGFSMDKIMFTSLINSYRRNRKMKMAMRVFVKMLKMGCDPDTYTYDTLIHGFADLKLFDKVWALHNHMMNSGLEADVVTYQIIMCKYCKLQKVDCALGLLDHMRLNNITPNVHCYTAIIPALCKENRFREVDELYEKMIDSGVVPDHIFFFSLINNYPKVHELRLAHMILGGVASNVCGIDLSSISSSADLASTKDLECEIELLLGKIRESRLNLTDMAFSIYVVALCTQGKVEAAMQCIDKMVGFGFQPFILAYNSLLKCLCQSGNVQLTKILTGYMEDEGIFPNLASYLVMVNEHCKRDDLASAFDVLQQMDKRGLKPTVAIYDTIISCLGRGKRIVDAHNIFASMLESGVDPDQNFIATMINAYSKNGRANEARQLFDLMLEHGMKPSFHAYNSLISGLIKKNKTDKGCLYLSRMLEEGFVPNNVLYTSLINSFLRKGELVFAFRLVDLMERSKIEHDLVTLITIVSGVSRNILEGRWRGSHTSSVREREMLFNLLNQKALLPRGKGTRICISSHEQMKFFARSLISRVKDLCIIPSLYLYNGIISGFCRMGSMQDAYHHLDMMQKEGVGPNQVTFTILIDGHIRLGESDLAIGLFNKMNAHGCDPCATLYNTLIKGLCKTGRLHDALSLSQTMHKRGLSPNKSAYEILCTSLCASGLSTQALMICEDMAAHNYVPSQYNCNWLLSIFLRKKRFNEAHMLQAMLS